MNLNPVSVRPNEGDEYLKADVGGAFTIGFTAGLASELTELVSTTYVPRFGHYLAIQSPVQAIGDGGERVLNASTAGRIDRKLDDGQPNTGTVVAAGARQCATATDNTGIYQESYTQTLCAIYSRIAQ